VETQLTKSTHAHMHTRPTSCIWIVYTAAAAPGAADLAALKDGRLNQTLPLEHRRRRRPRLGDGLSNSLPDTGQPVAWLPTEPTTAAVRR
jgi:hypothetical protein